MLSHSLSGSISRPGCGWLPCCSWHTPNSFFLLGPCFIAHLPRMKHTSSQLSVWLSHSSLPVLPGCYVVTHLCRLPCVNYQLPHTLPSPLGPALLFKANMVFVVTVMVDSHFWNVSCLNQGLDLFLVLCPWRWRMHSGRSWVIGRDWIGSVFMQRND